MMPALKVNLAYQDAPGAIRFLTETLGFEVVSIYEGADETFIMHAELRWSAGGSVTLRTASAKDDSVSRLTQRMASKSGYPVFSVHLDTEDPDGLYARVLSHGAKVVREIADSPHGTRGFVVQDPEGLYWSVGTSLPPQTRQGEGWQGAQPR